MDNIRLHNDTGQVKWFLNHAKPTHSEKPDQYEKDYQLNVAGESHIVTDTPVNKREMFYVSKNPYISGESLSFDEEPTEVTLVDGKTESKFHVRYAYTPSFAITAFAEVRFYAIAEFNIGRIPEALESILVEFSTNSFATVVREYKFFAPYVRDGVALIKFGTRLLVRYAVQQPIVPWINFDLQTKWQVSPGQNICIINSTCNLSAVEDVVVERSNQPIEPISMAGESRDVPLLVPKYSVKYKHLFRLPGTSYTVGMGKDKRKGKRE